MDTGIPGMSAVMYRSLNFESRQGGTDCALWAFLCHLVQVQLSMSAYVTLKQKEREKRGEEEWEKLSYFSSPLREKND